MTLPNRLSGQLPADPSELRTMIFGTRSRGYISSLSSLAGRAFDRQQTLANEQANRLVAREVQMKMPKNPPGVLKGRDDSKLKVERISQPSMMDIVFGRGKPYQTYPGNRAFHHAIDMFKNQYFQANRQTKLEIELVIVDLMNQAGSRFLKRSKEPEGNWWEVANRQESAKKVLYTMRSRKNRPHIPAPLDPSSFVNELRLVASTRPCDEDIEASYLSSAIAAERVVPAETIGDRRENMGEKQIFRLDNHAPELKKQNLPGGSLDRQDIASFVGNVQFACGEKGPNENIEPFPSLFPGCPPMYVYGMAPALLPVADLSVLLTLSHQTRTNLSASADHGSSQPVILVPILLPIRPASAGFQAS